MAMTDEKQLPDESLQKITLFLSRENHGLMKTLSKRKRVALGALYDQATAMFLKHPSNYMSLKQTAKLRKVK